MVDFSLIPGYREAPDSTLQRWRQEAATSKLGTNAVLPASRLRGISGAFLFLIFLFLLAGGHDCIVVSFVC